MNHVWGVVQQIPHLSLVVRHVKGGANYSNTEVGPFLKKWLDCQIVQVLDESSLILVVLARVTVVFKNVYSIQCAC